MADEKKGLGPEGIEIWRELCKPRSNNGRDMDTTGGVLPGGNSESPQVSSRKGLRGEVPLAQLRRALLAVR